MHPAKDIQRVALRQVGEVEGQKYKGYWQKIDVNRQREGPSTKPDNEEGLLALTNYSCF